MSCVMRNALAVDTANVSALRNLDYDGNDFCLFGL